MSDAARPTADASDATSATGRALARVASEAPHLVVLDPAPPEEHPAAVYLAHLATGSRRTMREALDTMAGLLTGGHADAQTLDWGLLRRPHTAALRTVLAERYAPATANKMLAALRGVLKEAWRLDLIEVAPYQRAVDLPAVRGETLPRGRALPPGELRSLFAACADGTPLGTRDAALLAVLYGAGLRRSEAVALDVGDYEAAEGALTIRSGKGHKERLTYLAASGCDALEAWLDARGRGEGQGALFVPLTKTGRLLPRRLTDQAVRMILQHRAGLAGIRACTPHDLRRTCISHLLDAGADITTVQKLVGHASVTTTGRYDRRGEATKRDAAGLLHIPVVVAPVAPMAPLPTVIPYPARTPHADQRRPAGARKDSRDR